MNSPEQVSSPISFRHWKRKSYAIFCTLQKTVRIGVLSVSYFLSAFGVKAQTINEPDTLKIPGQQIEEVVVSAGRTPVGSRQTARLVTIVSRPEIERAPVQSVNDVLRFVSSLDIRQRGPLGAQADIGIRGGTYDQTLILLNGINISDPQSGHHCLNLPVDPESIERIEILLGPAAKSFGPNAFNGAVNLITGNSRSDHVRATLAAGQFGLIKGSVNVSNTLGKFTHFLDASRISSGGYTHNTDFSNTMLFYQASLRPGLGVADLQAGYSQRAFGANSFYSLRYPDQFEAEKTTFLSLKYQSNTRIRFSSAAYFRSNRDRFELFRNDESKVPFNHHLSAISGINLTLWTIHHLGKTSLGLDIRHEQIVSTILGESLDKPLKIPGFEALYTRYFSRLNTGFFAEHFFSGNRITFQSGVMVYYNSRLLGFHIYPGIDVSYRIRKYISLYAAWNKSLRMPTFTDMFYKSPVQQGNPGLLPEKAVTLESGVKYNGPAVTAHLAAFLRRGTDLIDWVKDPSPDSLIWRSMNHAEINLRGFECSLKFVPAGDSPWNRILSAGISYAFLHGDSGRDYLLSKYVLDYLRHQLISSLDFRIAGKLFGTVHMTWRARNGTYQDPAGQIQKYCSYCVTDSRIYRKTDHITFFADITNVFNAVYMDYGGITQPGRWFTAGIMLNVNYLK